MRAAFNNIRGRLGTNLIGAEIGVWKGKISREVLKGLSISKYYMIDPYIDYPETWRMAIWEGKSSLTKEDWDTIYKGVVDSFKSVKNVCIMRLTSEEAAKQFKDNFFDFAYIDACHEPEWIKKDLEIWYPKIKKGCILCGHDWTFKSVRTAVVEFCLKNNYFFEAISHDWWIYKK